VSESVAAANPHDHALVIGIRRYADVAAGWVKDLKGPDHDAAAVAAWLRSPAGGGLPHDNVRVICSADFPDPFEGGHGEPAEVRISKAFKEIARLPKAHGQFAGRRLYVYVSGHGFATRRDQAGILAADSVKVTPLIVDVTSFTNWLYEAATFQELVLWADACAERVPPTHLVGFPERPQGSPNAPSVRLFESFAAPIGLRAVENQMPDGQWHGAFTYALLRGLEGAAQTPVTSITLRNYLRNALKGFIGEADRGRKTVAKEPAFGRTDEVQLAAPAASTFSVTIHFPPEAVGKLATVARGRTVPPADQTTLADTQWRPSLEAGLYVVLVSDLGLAETFEVGGGLEAEVIVS